MKSNFDFDFDIAVFIINYLCTSIFKKKSCAHLIFNQKHNFNLSLTTASLL